MTMKWVEHEAQRPDRYLDWELASRPPGDQSLSGRRWCAVLVQVTVGPPGDPAFHLRSMRGFIDTQPPKGPLGIRIHADESELLDETIRDVELGRYQPAKEDDAGFQFFVYLPEELAYVNGGYAHIDHYRIRLVGPPVERLTIDAAIERDASRFQPLQGDALAQSVAIGVIDHGLAFAHQRFRTRHGASGLGGERTRVCAIWMQELETPDPDDGHGISFGKRFMADDIDGLLQKSAATLGRIDDVDVYRRAGLLDFGRDAYKPLSRRTAHGTHVMDLAAGFDPDDPSGLSRPILAVQLPADATADTSGITMGTYVLQGLRQIMLWADKLDNGRPMPLVVNFSYGFFAGPKDGSHVLEREIDRLISHRDKKANTAVVLPAGNSFRSRTAARMLLSPGSSGTIDWAVLPDDRTPSFMEIWCGHKGSEASPVSIELAPPDPWSQATVTSIPGRALHLKNEGRPIGAVYHDEVTSHEGAVSSRIFLALGPTASFAEAAPVAPHGCWRVSVANTSSNPIEVALYVQRDDTQAGFRPKGRQSHFFHPAAFERDSRTGDYDNLGISPITHSWTLSAIGNGEKTVLVGAALGDAGIQPAAYASSGPTVSRNGPDFCSVSDEGFAHAGIFAAGPLTGATVAQRGSSVAAPQVARRLADAGASVKALKQRFPTQENTDPRLGNAFVPASKRDDMPARRWPAEPTTSSGE